MLLLDTTKLLRMNKWNKYTEGNLVHRSNRRHWLHFRIFDKLYAYSIDFIKRACMWSQCLLQPSITHLFKFLTSIFILHFIQRLTLERYLVPPYTGENPPFNSSFLLRCPQKRCQILNFWGYCLTQSYLFLAFSQLPVTTCCHLSLSARFLRQ